VKVTLIVNTSAAYFSSWLAEYTRDVSHRTFPTKKGYIILDQARPSPRGSGYIGMEHYYCRPNPEGGETLYAQLPEIIRFKLIPLADDRIEVIAECTKTDIEGYFQSILEEIDRRWPQSAFAKPTPLEDAISTIRQFKLYVERQSYKDIFVDNKPQENIARALLQAYLPERSYREVPVRAGRSDLLLFIKDGKFLYETKIWRGPQYYIIGLKELEEYIIGEDINQDLLGIFYILFDPTESQRAKAYLSGDFTNVVIKNRAVNVVVVGLSPSVPSSKRRRSKAD
jgi:hypothetical protein